MNPPHVSGSTRLVGVVSGAGTAFVTAVYAAVLAAGFLSLPSPDQPIGDPYFTLLEVLILLLMPLQVALMAAVYGAAPREGKVFGLLALVFMALVAGLTCSLHFVILTVGRDPAITGLPWMESLLAFRWPSVGYALDVLAWDLFFPLSVLAAAPVFRGGRLERWIRRLLVASGVLALAGLGGVALGDMGWRNVGILGYAGVFPVAAALVAWWFHRTGRDRRRGPQPGPPEGGEGGDPERAAPEASPSLLRATVYYKVWGTGFSPQIEEVRCD